MDEPNDRRIKRKPPRVSPIMSRREKMSPFVLFVERVSVLRDINIVDSIPLAPNFGVKEILAGMIKGKTKQ